jgi:hypothetical protein
MSVAYNSSIVTTGLKLCLDPANIKSYPGSGTIFSDISRNGLNATLTSSFTGPILNSGRSATTPVTGVLNTDLHSIFFSIKFNTTITYGANGYSGSWEKIFSFNAGGSDRTPSVWRYPSERRLHWRYDPSNSGCDFGKDSASNQFDIDTWYYVGVTKNNASTVMYVNGAQIGTGTVSYPKTTGTSSIILFESYTADLASLGFVHIYDRPITASEVNINFSAIRKRYNI